MRKEHTKARYMGPKTLAGLLETVGFWKRLALGRELTVAAAETISYLDKRQGDLTRELAHTKMQHKQEIQRIEKDAERAAKDLYRRTCSAIDEMSLGKGNFKGERPVAVVLSPYQHAQLTHHGFFRQHKLKDLDILIAKGVYGPVVLTQDGLNGFTRNAPELNIRAAAPSKSNW